MPDDDLDGRIGEAFGGTAPNGTHINLVIGVRGSATAATISGALAQTAPGHVPFLACLDAGYAVRPATVIRNKATLTTPHLEQLTYGAVQLGIADGVMGAVADGLFDRARVDDLVLLVAVSTNADGDDQAAVRAANAEATQAAIADALSPTDVDALLARRVVCGNEYYSA